MDSTIGEKLKVIREAKGLKQKELAEILNIPPTTYNSYELSKVEPPASFIRLLTEKLGVNPCYILFNKGPVFLDICEEISRKSEVEKSGEKLYIIKNTLKSVLIGLGIGKRELFKLMPAEFVSTEASFLDMFEKEVHMPERFIRSLAEISGGSFYYLFNYDYYIPNFVDDENELGAVGKEEPYLFYFRFKDFSFFILWLRQGEYAGKFVSGIESIDWIYHETSLGEFALQFPKFYNFLTEPYDYDFLIELSKRFKPKGIFVGYWNTDDYIEVLGTTEDSISAFKHPLSHFKGLGRFLGKDPKLSLGRDKALIYFPPQAYYFLMDRIGNLNLNYQSELLDTLKSLEFIL